MLQLRYEDQGVSRVHQLRQGVTLIGRLPSCDLVLHDPSVSRQHATLRVIEADCRLQDAGSRFGTFLDGTAVGEDVPVRPGATIRLGEIALVLEQHVPEHALLSEQHQIAEGPGTICRPMPPVAGLAGDSHLIRLLSDVGRTLLSSQSLVDMLNKVVDMTFSVVPADRAFLMLRESSDEALAARVLRHRDGTIPPNPTLSRMVVRRVMRDRVAMLAADATSDPGLGMTDSMLRFNIRSFMCAPLWNREEVIGVLYVDSPRSAQFGPSDLDAFTGLTNAAAIALEQQRLASQLLEETRRRERLQRYHSPSVVSRILQAPEGEAGLEALERDVTVMFCDLVGFTTLCEHIPPAQAASLLNAFLTRMTDVVFEHDGTLDKFLGDALLAVFGAPFDLPDHPRRAVDAALAMRRALASLNRVQEGPKLEMRIALNTGIALTGDIGSPRRREFTVLGDVVNAAARMEEVAAPGEIVIAAATKVRLGGEVRLRPLGARTLRGRTTTSELFAVEA
jgi:adenylate cyclase